MLRLLLLSVVLSLVASSGSAAPAPLVTEHTFLSVTIKNQPYVLQTLVVKEAGRQQRLPIALITHGMSADLDRRRSLDASAFTRTARDFARRGWLAVAVVRRGFGQSSPLPSNVRDDCRTAGFGPVLERQTDDIEAALAAIRSRADADGERAIAIGGSVGGAIVLNLAGRAPAGLRAVVNVSGGVRSRTEAEHLPGCALSSLPSIFAAYGAKSRLPGLWLYAENDLLFPGDYVRELHQSFIAAGGKSEFHMFPAIGKDGHNFFVTPDGMLYWMPVLDRFLRAQALPTFDQAKLDTALTAARSSNGLPVSNALRSLAQRYHGRTTEKAFSLSISGRFAQAKYGSRSPEEAMEGSLEACEKGAKEPCRVLWLNFDVVE